MRVRVRISSRVGDDFSVFEVDGTRSRCADVRIMGNDDNRRTLPVNIEKKIEYGLPRLGIEGAGRFVGKDQLRTGYKGAGNGDTLLLPPRKARSDGA